MPAIDLSHAVAAFWRCVLAGAELNPVAGGGTLLTFPTLVCFGLPLGHC